MARKINNNGMRLPKKTPGDLHTFLDNKIQDGVFNTLVLHQQLLAKHLGKLSTKTCNQIFSKKITGSVVYGKSVSPQQIFVTEEVKKIEANAKYMAYKQEDNFLEESEKLLDVFRERDT